MMECIQHRLITPEPVHIAGVIQLYIYALWDVFEMLII
jgi:hypothetical protein